MQRALGTAAAIPPGYSFLPQSGCWEAAGVLQPHNFCLCWWPKTSWVFPAFRCARRSVYATQEQEHIRAGAGAHQPQEHIRKAISRASREPSFLKFQGSQPLQQCCCLSTPGLSLLGLYYTSCLVPSCWMFEEKPVESSPVPHQITGVLPGPGLQGMGWSLCLSKVTFPISSTVQSSCWTSWEQAGIWHQHFLTSGRVCQSAWNSFEN